MTYHSDPVRDIYNNLPGEYKERYSPSRLTRDFWLGDIGKDDDKKPVPYDDFVDDYGPTPVAMWTPIDWQLQAAQFYARGRADHHRRHKAGEKKPVTVIRKDGCIEEHASAKVAAKVLSISADMVYHHCRTGTPSKHGHKMYYTKTGPIDREKMNGNKIKPVMMITECSSEIFDSAKALSIALGIHHTSVHRKARSGKEINGVTIRYLTTMELGRYRKERRVT